MPEINVGHRKAHIQWFELELPGAQHQEQVSHRWRSTLKVNVEAGATAYVAG
jgi:hypothetical protein